MVGTGYVKETGMLNLSRYLVDMIMSIIDHLFGLLISTGLLRSNDERNTGDPYGDCEAELYHSYEDYDWR